ncbi:DNA polymerase III subunit delta' [Thiohalocapsa halophila]|uniref:DNA polymerase III subunit delta' n=1 Tax=Thiohalocapsa halophila TaxID=69359 RepID=A0ABS1CNS1_9GAMM|nr:DNA polymerase III subunit delta' [Thiohalocapsa halophila]MBK1633144.1 DNA polymerase III subunit delta' [Thiohalocapsa halophila]
MILSEPVPLVLLPWQQDQWQSMQAAVRSDRLGHALLIQGPAGIGKRRFADLLAASVLCAQPGADGLPCGACAECQLLAAGNHPDLTRLVPDADSKTGEILAGQVRAVCGSQTMTSSRGRRAVYRIAPAEAMNPVAANSLLKTLEEPASATLWLLVAEAPSSLPATVRSRCHKLTMPPPAAEQALAWLRGELAGGEGGGDRPAAGSDAEQLLVLGQGAPLRALALAGETDLQAREQCLTAFQQVSAGKADPIAVAKAWQSLEPRLVLDWLVGWVSDWLRLQMDPHAAHLINPDQRRRLAGIASGVGAAGGHRFLQQLYAARSEAQSSVNKQLLFESLLLRWAALTRPRAQGRAG